MDLQRQLDETRRQQERLLNLHLSGGIDETAFSTKNVELRDRISTLTFELQSSDRRKDEKVDATSGVFELRKVFRERWVKADYAQPPLSANGLFELGSERRKSLHINKKALQRIG